MWSVRSSRRADVFLIVGGFMALAAAAVVMMYALVAGAVAVIVGLVHIAKSHSRRRAEQRPLEQAAAPVFESPPSTDYSLLVDVDPNWAADPSAVTSAARATFAAWTRLLPKGPRDASTLLRRTSPMRRLLVRQDTWTEGRRLAWRSAAFEGRGKAGAPPVEAAQFDAWSPPADLMNVSRYVASCGTCTGTGKIACRQCNGDGKLRCADCGGDGKIHGRTANGHQRLLNCKVCRGTGRTTCTFCTRGKLNCTSCHGAKREERWLEVEVWHRQDVQVEPDDYQRVFSWSRDGHPATRPQMEADAFVVDQISLERPIAQSDAPASIPSGDRERVLTAVRPQMHPGERIQRQQLTVLEVPVVGVTYGIGDDEQTIELMGRRLLAPQPAVDTLLTERSRLLNWVGGALAVAPLAAGVAYLSRGPYFASAQVGGIVGAVLAAAVLVFVVLWHLTIGRRAALKWLALVPVPLAAASVFALLAEPSIDDARAHVKAGRLDAAEVELRALGSETDPDLQPVWADFYLARLNKEPDVAKARVLADRIPPDLPQLQIATARIDTLLLAAAKSALAGGRAADVERLLRQGSARLQAEAETKRTLTAAVIAIGKDCLDRDDYRCAVERAVAATTEDPVAAGELRQQALTALQGHVDYAVQRSEAKDLRERVAALTEAIARLSEYEALSRPEVSEASLKLTMLRERLVKDRVLLDKQIAAEERKLAAEERKLAAQRAAEEARQRRIEERETKRRAAEDRRNESRWSGGGCCKYCSTGKPCGDTCISRNKTCHVGGGCAC